MKLGLCIHLEESRSALCSICDLTYFYGPLNYVEFLRLGYFQETIMARAMKLGLCIHLEELTSTLPSIMSPDLLFTVH